MFKNKINKKMLIPNMKKDTTGNAQLFEEVLFQKDLLLADIRDVKTMRPDILPC